ncbi:MAG: YlbF family regulator [Euryarchaeota archaeon]|nr:YlbF family regulator [Euryarchaeota archaeon]
MTNEEVIKKARALGEALKNSEEYKELMEAQKALDEDTETQEMLKQYEARRNELQIKQMTGQSIENEIKEITDMEGEIMGRESMKKYTEAEEKFKNLVDAANQEIVKAMEDEEEEKE